MYAIFPGKHHASNDAQRRHWNKFENRQLTRIDMTRKAIGDAPSARYPRRRLKSMTAFHTCFRPRVSSHSFVATVVFFFNETWLHQSAAALRFPISRTRASAAATGPRVFSRGGNEFAAIWSNLQSKARPAPVMSASDFPEWAGVFRSYSQALRRAGHFLVLIGVPKSSAPSPNRSRKSAITSCAADNEGSSNCILHKGVLRQDPPLIALNIDRISNLLARAFAIAGIRRTK